MKAHICCWMHVNHKGVEGGTKAHEGLFYNFADPVFEVAVVEVDGASPTCIRKCSYKFKSVQDENHSEIQLL